MSGSLKIAFALWLSAKIPGVAVVGQTLANQDADGLSSYPECLITRLSREEEMIGLPKNTDRVKNADGHVIAKGKLAHEETTYRLTFAATDDAATGTPGLTTAEALRRTVRDTIRQTQLSGGITLTDTEANPDELFNVRRMELIGENEIPADTEQVPFVYRCAMTVRLIRVVRIERPVEHVFETITVTEGPYGTH